MKKKIIKTAINLLLVFAFIGGVHLLLLEFVLPADYKETKLIFIYIFLYFFIVLGMTGVYAVQKNNKEQLTNALLAFTVLQFLASLIFLLPELLNKDENTLKYVYQFFGVFFPVLLVESLILIGIVNEKEEK